MFPYFCPFFITNAYFCFFLKRSAILQAGNLLRKWPPRTLASEHSPEPPLPPGSTKKSLKRDSLKASFIYVIILLELHKVVASTLEVILKKPPNGCRQQGQNPFVKKHRRCCLWNLFQTTLM